MLKFTIPMEPVAKGRARTITRGGKTWSYTPKKTQDAEDSIRAMVINTLNKPDGIHALPDNVPLRLEVIFYRTKSKWTKDNCDMPISRPDLDNYGKLLCDALNGLLVKDEQIVTTLFGKRWQAPDKEGCIEVTIYPYVNIKGGGK